MRTLVDLGPWSGIDNVHAPDHPVFGPPREGQRPAALTAAVDVDLDDAGQVRSRPGTTVLRAVRAPVQVWAGSGRWWVQDGDALVRDDGVVAVTGLRRRAALVEHWGTVFGSDGSTHFQILADGSATNWGLPVPAVSVQAVTGALPTGTYLVQAAAVDAAGNEGGVSDLAAAVLAEGQSLLVEVAPLPRSVVAVNLYAGSAGQPRPTFQAQVPVTSLPYTLTTLSGAADPPRTAQMQGPWTGLEGAASFRAFLLLWRGNAIVRSEAAEPHLFHPDNLMQFPAPVVGVVGVAGGLWVATAGGLWFVAGEDPGQWVPVQKTFRPVLAGGAAVPGGVIPAAQTGDLCGLFAAREGMWCGRPDGSLLNLTDQRYQFASGARASVAVTRRPADGLSQILVCAG